LHFPLSVSIHAGSVCLETVERESSTNDKLTRKTAVTRKSYAPLLREGKNPVRGDGTRQNRHEESSNTAV
jgi:hypothetical protein